jgi:hypothetical protein
LRAARRERFVSAAQVAYHYGAYQLKDALQLNKDERNLLLAVSLSEQERSFKRFEVAMGLVWDIEDLVSHAGKKTKRKKGDKKEAEKLPRQVRIPALLALAPEMFKAISEEYRRKYRAASAHGDNVPAGHKVVEMGNLSKEEAQAIWKQLSAQMG